MRYNIIMSMIKRAKSGRIKEVVNNKTKKAEAFEEINEDVELVWNQAVIKDVLDVPTVNPYDVAVNLDDDDDDGVIAVRV